MNLRIMLIAPICLFMLSACCGDIHEQGGIKSISPPSSNESSDEAQFSAQMSALEYLPDVFPEWCRDDIVPESTYVRAALTDGSIIIVPDMKLADLPQSFRDTLTCSERDNIYGERAGTYTNQEAQDALYAVYQTDDLQFTTIYYNPNLNERYEDAGVEYIREVIALSDKFCTYQGARLGDSAKRFIGNGIETWQTSGTPYMEYSADNDVLTGLHSCAFSEISSLKSKEIRLLTHNER